MAVTLEEIKVPRIANDTIAPKFEKNGFWQVDYHNKLEYYMHNNKK